MTEYSFTLIIDSLGNVDEVFSDEKIDALFEAGCDDATFGSVDGAHYADFNREASTLGEALSSAIAAVESVPGLRVRRVEPDDLVTMSEIAKRLGRTRESVRLLIAGERGPGDFPHPVSHLRSRNRLWRWSNVASWAFREDNVEARTNARFIAAVNATLDLHTQLQSPDLLESERDLVLLNLYAGVAHFYEGAAHRLGNTLWLPQTLLGGAEGRYIDQDDESSLPCPYCDHDTKVIDKRTSEGKDAIRHRRECPSCGKQFTTYERREPLRLVVIKRDGTREPFDRAKLQAGLVKACANRPIPEEEIEYIVNEIEAELRERRKHEVMSRRLGDMALVRLRRLDMVAYLRFASVYRQYTDVEQFRESLNRVEEGLDREDQLLQKLEG